MAHIPPPIPLLNAVESYDVTPDPTPGKRMNLAIASFFRALEDDAMHAQVAEYGHTHSTNFSQWKTRNPETSFLGNQVLLKATPDVVKDVYAMGACHVFHAKVLQVEPLTFQVDDQTLILSDNKSDSTLWMVEQFAGSFGGWSHGLRYFRQFFQHGEDPKVLAIEAHLPHVINFALAHKYQIVGSTEGLSPSFLKDHPDNTIVHSTIQDIQWQKLIQNIHTFAWLISAPCLSWSNAGTQKGFHVPEGQCLADSVGQAKIHKPDYLLLEQVSGFPTHSHFDMFCRLLAWAGYRIIHQQCYELADVCPARRRCRWIAICHHVSISPPYMPIATWPKLMTTPEHFDAILCLDDMQLRQFEPSIEVKSQLATGTQP